MAKQKQKKDKKQKERIKGTFNDRIIKHLIKSKAKVAVNFSDDTELTGVVTGIGQYAFVLSTNAGDVLVQKHAVRYLMPVDSKVRLKWGR